MSPGTPRVGDTSSGATPNFYAPDGSPLRPPVQHAGTRWDGIGEIATDFSLHQEAEGVAGGVAHHEERLAVVCTAVVQQ